MRKVAISHRRPVMDHHGTNMVASGPDTAYAVNRRAPVSTRAANGERRPHTACNGVGMVGTTNERNEGKKRERSGKFGASKYRFAWRNSGR